MDKTKWGLCWSNWGDTICNLGYFRATIGCGPIIYHGPFPDIVQFLQAQSFISEVYHLPAPSGFKVGGEIHDLFYHPENAADAISRLLKNTPIFSNQVVPSWMYAQTEELHWVYDLQLPEIARTWAKIKLANIPRPRFLVQPYSFASTGHQNHWPHWIAAMKWMFADESKQFILSGLSWNSSFAYHYPNVQPWVERVPSMLQVLALAELCDGVITTSNALSHWSVSQHLPCVVLCNAESSKPNSIFRRLTQGPSIDTLNFDTALPSAIYHLSKRFDITPDPVVIARHCPADSPLNFHYTFTPETVKHIRHVWSYCQGVGIDIGAGGHPIHPRAISIDRSPSLGQIVANALQLPWFKDSSLDYVYSSHCLEDFADWMPPLKEWMRVVRPDGHLVLLIPDHKRFRAHVAAGQTDNPDHRHEGEVGELTRYVKRIGGNDWQVIKDEFADASDYTILFVAQRLR